MSAINKILVIAILAMVAIIVWLVVDLAQLNKRYAADTARLIIELSDCKTNVRDANAAIEKQNAAIEAIRIDTVIVERRINNVVDKYSFIRETVRVSVEKDDTYENKVNNIDYVLRRFHGVELRPANGD